MMRCMLVMALWCVALILRPLDAVDVEGMAVIHRGTVTVFAEDSRDYADFCRHIETSLAGMERMFGSALDRKPTIYVYRDLRSTSKRVFGSDTETIQTAMADPVNKILYVTSPFDEGRTPEYYRSVPVHELAHLFFSPKDGWLREGFAVYQAGQLGAIPDPDAIRGYADFDQKRRSDREFLEHYNRCGWFAKFLFERKLQSSIPRFIRFSKSSDKAAFLGSAGMDSLVAEWKTWMRGQNPAGNPAAIVPGPRSGQ